MPAMLNLITLYREAIHEPVQRTVRSQESPELAMDYFDTLIAQRIDPHEDSIKKFLGLNIDEDFDQNQIAMQSIPLYCPADVYDTYAEKYRGIYRDPFLTKGEDNGGDDDAERVNLRSAMPYLSMIEVFITPEVIARLDLSSLKERKRNDCFDREERPSLRVYNYFYRDLHLLMEGFLESFREKNNTDEKFIYCIYESLSIGDFAVVIRSSRPETAFKVTTLLRKRSCELQYLTPDTTSEVAAAAPANQDPAATAPANRDPAAAAPAKQAPAVTAPAKTAPTDIAAADTAPAKTAPTDIAAADPAPDNQDPDNLVLYKTFTIFSLNEAFGEHPLDLGHNDRKSCGPARKGNDQPLRTDIIPPDEEENTENASARNSCRYVIRGVLSNLYWSRAQKNGHPDIMTDGKIRSNFRRLHGRYDFTVTISEQAFRAIHPVLVRYKLDRDISLAKDAKDIIKGQIMDKDEEDICITLIEYIRNGYISYINERYLFNLDIGSISVEKCNEDIRLLPVEGDLKFTNVYIEDEIQKLKNRIARVDENVLFLNTSRGSIDYSMKLIGKLANICSTVNGISDARIYSLVIRRQIEAVLNGIDEYLTYIEKSDDLSIVKHLDQDLKEAIESINSFAQFILESSMQSFQAPTYNLESHVSVEKMLTSYSWFLQSVLDWLEHSRFSASIRGNTQKYLTVMVPDALDRKLSTKAIFFKLNDRNNAAREKLLTVYCPSFTDMTDFTGSFGVLFHELAHYMRYASRYDRNRMVLSYSSMLLFDQTAENIAADIQHNILYMTDVNEIRTSLVDCFSEAYKETVYQKNMNLYAGANTNFMLMIQEIKTNYCQFIENIRFLSEFETALTSFLNHSSYIVDRRSKDVMNSMKAIYNGMFRETETWQSPRRILKLLKDGVRLLDDYSTYYLNTEANALEESAYIARLLQNIGALFREDDEEVIVFLDACADVQLFYRLFYENLLRYLDKNWNDGISRRIYSYLFGDAKYKEEGIAALRRYVSTFIIYSRTENLELIDQSLAVYREVSSDLYMVKALNLTPYGYFNFFIKQVPMEEYIGKTYMERFCKVLYAIRGEDVRGNKTTWRDVFADIFSGICDFIGHITAEHREVLYNIEADNNGKMRKALENLKKGFELLEREALWAAETVRGKTDMLSERPDQETICDYCYGLYNDVLLSMWDNALSLTRMKSGNPRTHQDFQKCLWDIKRSIFLCKAFTQISEEFPEQRESVERYEILTEDLFNGNRNLERMYQEFRRSDLMKYYCSKVAQEYNEPVRRHPCAGQESAMSDCIWKIDFIMDMHYGMIWDYASKILKSSD